MGEKVQIPELVMKTTKSQFRLRCHAVSWAEDYGGWLKMQRRHPRQSPGLVLLSVTGPDTAVKSVRATLYQPSVEAAFVLEGDEGRHQMVKARAGFDGIPVAYNAAKVKLASGIIHMVAVAKIPGLMPTMSDDHLWSELTSPRYTTPLLRTWIPWLKESMIQSGNIIVAQGFASTVGVLRIEPDELDALVSRGVKQGHLRMVA